MLVNFIKDLDLSRTSPSLNNRINKKAIVNDSSFVLYALIYLDSSFSKRFL